MAFFRRRTDDVRREEEDVRGWGGPPLVRAIFTLVGVAAAGLLIWLAQTFDVTSAHGFWAVMGLVAAAGLALGLSQLFGGWTKWGLPVFSPGVLLLAFVPTAIVVAWILLATQPAGGWQQERLASWSSDIGVGGFVTDMGTLPAALAMGLGIVFAFTFDTTGPRTTMTREVVRRDVPDEDVHDYDRRDEVPATTSTDTTTTADDRTMVVGNPERRDTP